MDARAAIRAATITVEFFQRFGLAGVGPWVLGCFPSSEEWPRSLPLMVSLSRRRDSWCEVPMCMLSTSTTRCGLWVYPPTLGTNETESAAAIRARLSGRCRADRDGARAGKLSAHVDALPLLIDSPGGRG